MALDHLSRVAAVGNAKAALKRLECQTPCVSLMKRGAVKRCL
jgi:hypothetical protein